jgi:hypothetical protein
VAVEALPVQSAWLEEGHPLGAAIRPTHNSCSGRGDTLIEHNVDKTTVRFGVTL